MYSPNADRIDEKWLIQSVLYYAPQYSETTYWLPILGQLNIKLSYYDELSLKDIADTPFVETIFWCYSILSKNKIKWALDDLKDCIRNEAPDLWKELHPHSILGFFGGPGIWKKIGGDRITANSSLGDTFSDWLLKGK